MSGSAPARRTNRILLAAVGAACTVVGAAALFGERGGRGAAPEPTAPVASTTVPDDTDPDGWRLAPATPADATYPMESLSCAAMGALVRLDLCGVFDGASERFLVAAAEAYWDPGEPDFDGVVRVPLVVSVYVLDATRVPSAAVPEMTGIIAVPYGTGHDEVGLYQVSGEAGAGESSAVVWTSRETLRAAALERAQVIDFAGRAPVARPMSTDGTDLRLVNAYVFPRLRNLVAD